MSKYFFIILGVLLLFQSQVNAQSSTGSIYSAFGLGQVERSGSGKTRLLAGTGIGLPSKDYLNNVNPASFGAIDSLRFIFEGGVSSSYSRYTSSELVQKHSTSNFNYLAMGFQMSNWWKSSLGMKPFSHVGYNITTTKYIEGTTETYDTYFTGQGDIAQLYWSSAFIPLKNLYLGVNVSYLFGNITQEELVEVPVTLTEETITQVKYVHSFYTDFGLQYSFRAKRHNYTIGAIYGPQKKLASSSTLSLTNSADSTITTTVEDVMKYSLPEKAGIGMSVSSLNRNFVLSLDYRWENWEEMRLEKLDATLKNSHRYSMGLEYVPEKTLHDPYWRRIRYMGGLYYTDTSLEYKGSPIREMGLSLGFGFPMRDQQSHFDLGLEYMQKGTTRNGLIQENVFKVNMSFTLTDRWFQKRKFQ